MEQILEKILTGNLGYGTIIIIVGILVACYYAIIEPRIKQLEKQKEKDDSEINELKSKIEGQDTLIKDNLKVIQDQQKTIGENAEAMLKTSTLIESSFKVETLEQLMLKLSEKLEDIASDSKDISRELMNELNKDGHILEGFKATIEGMSKENSSSISKLEKRMESIDKNIQSITSSRYDIQSDTSARLSSLVTEVRDLKSMLAMNRSYSRSIGGQEDYSVMQDLK